MKLKGEFFDVYINAVKNSQKGSFIVVVSAKVSKKAVLRNKIKRQIREVIRLYPFDFSKIALKVIATEKTVGKKYDLLKKDLESLLNTVL